jgi:hypothetical protein
MPGNRVPHGSPAESRDNSRLIGLIGAGLILIMAAWTALWFFTNHEYRYRQERGEMSPQARRNPLLAAEHFLDRLGLEAESVGGRQYLTDPPADTDLILVHHLGRDLLPEQQQRLHDWVEAGGHLVVTPGRTWEAEGENDALLELVGARLLESDWLCEDVADDDCRYDLAHFEEAQYDGPISLRFQADRILQEGPEHPADWALAGESGDHLLHYRIGNGALTLLSDNELLENDTIGKYDHALFLALLSGDARRVTLLYSSGMPGLLSLIQHHLPHLALAFVATLILWLWQLRYYTGPPIPPPPRVRRNLLEHLHASAAYAWSVDRGEEMGEASRQALEQLWLKRHPGLAGMSLQQRITWIAEQSGLNERTVERALNSPAEREGELIRIASAQQKLRRSASHHQPPRHR